MGNGRSRQARAVVGVIVAMTALAVFWIAVRPFRGVDQPPSFSTSRHNPLAQAHDHSLSPSTQPALPTRLTVAEGVAETTVPGAGPPSMVSAPREQASDAGVIDPTTATISAEALDAAVRESETLRARAQLIPAHRVLSKIYREAALTTTQKNQLLKKLEPVGQKLFFTPQPPALENPYAVQPGDTLARIARRWQISSEYLQRLNRIADPRRIRTGQKLKVVRGPFEAVVDLSEFELVVYIGGLWVRRYPIGTGRDSSTPAGAFRVLNKVENPEYNGAEGHFAADDPNNPVGEHWIDLGDSYGIHGTIEPASIGRQASRGCLRLFPADVEEVFYFLTVGSRVEIRP